MPVTPSTFTQGTPVASRVLITGFAARHRLELHQAERLRARHRRQHEDIAGRIPRRDGVVFDRAQEEDA